LGSLPEVGLLQRGADGHRPLQRMIPYAASLLALATDFEITHGSFVSRY
jgi:hypothetical protein